MVHKTRGTKSSPHSFFIHNFTTFEQRKKEPKKETLQH